MVSMSSRNQLKKIEQNLEEYAENYWDEAKQALTDEANSILADSVKQTPVDTGTLRRSGTVEVTQDDNNDFRLAIGYNTEYAIYVHEDLTSQHDRGKAKFLEDPVNQRKPAIRRNMAWRLQRSARL